jgi:hypothetical protein
VAAKDRFHDAVKRGLKKDKWVITHEPLTIEFSEDDEVEIDLGAEQLLGAEKGAKKLQLRSKVF